MVNACFINKKASLALFVKKSKFLRVFRNFLAQTAKKVVVFSIEISNAAILLNIWIKQ